MTYWVFYLVSLLPPALSFFSLIFLDSSGASSMVGLARFAFTILTLISAWPISFLAFFTIRLVFHKNWTYKWRDFGISAVLTAGIFWFLSKYI